MRKPHPAVAKVLEASDNRQLSRMDRGEFEHTTSESLAKVLAIGCLAGLNPKKKYLDIWDPAAGSGFAGHLLVSALASSGIQVNYRAQDINIRTAKEFQRRFSKFDNCHIEVGDTLIEDLHPDYRADLVLVDPPWGMKWTQQENYIRKRQEHGEFRFGLPSMNDSTWLFISLALEKLKAPEDGGGRVAALVAPAALGPGGGASEVKEQILEQGLLESITWLPTALTPNTGIDSYLLVFNNSIAPSRKGKIQVANLQTEFTTSNRMRSLRASALTELETGLRSWKQGPLNRTIQAEQFNEFAARVRKPLENGKNLSWHLTTFNNRLVDESFLESRYGKGHMITIQTMPKRTINLDPRRILTDESYALIKAFIKREIQTQRLSNLITDAPRVVRVEENFEKDDNYLLIPFTPTVPVFTASEDSSNRNRALAVAVDQDQVLLEYLKAWLSSDEGIMSRKLAEDAVGSGSAIRASIVMFNKPLQWADELIVPIPSRKDQEKIANLHRQLRSYQAELEALRSTIWTEIDAVEATLTQIEGAFEKSLESWLERLPHPIASSLWTAHTASSPSDQKTSFIHAWEAIVAFHAIVLLSAIKSDTESSRQIETKVRETLSEQSFTIERPGFGTWVSMFEIVAKQVRQKITQRAVDNNKEADDKEKGEDKKAEDDISQIRKNFAGLSIHNIENLVSPKVVNLFRQVNTARNKWHGHSGYVSEDIHKKQVETLISFLHQLRELLGSVWAQLILVRARNGSKKQTHIEQKVELAVGTRSPFKILTLNVDQLLEDGTLYLAVEGAETPLKLLPLVQLRSAPTTAQFTSYFYNRTEGNDVRMISYHVSEESEIIVNLDDLRDEFGAMIE